MKPNDNTPFIAIIGWVSGITLDQWNTVASLLVYTLTGAYLIRQHLAFRKSKAKKKDEPIE